MPDGAAPPRLPYWPRVLNEAEAAAYVGLSPTTFAKRVAEGAIPPPVPLSQRRIGWDRLALDRWVDGLGGVASASAGSNPWDSILGGQSAA